MTIGTKSVLFGAHCFLLHPWFVAWGWWRLYGFPWDPRLWVAFGVHDLGYLGKPNMDGPEGETHPDLGAKMMSFLFDNPDRDEHCPVCWGHIDYPREGGGLGVCGRCRHRAYGWYDFCLLHSRYYAKSMGRKPSRLCMADKLAIALTPAWLYLPMVRATGEIHEYMRDASGYVFTIRHAVSIEEQNQMLSGSQRAWYAGVQEYCSRWAWAHKDGIADTWTSDARQRATLGDDGVWK